MPPTQSTDAEYLIKEFNRDQSWIAAAYIEYLADTESVQYSELQAIKALANYLKFDLPSYELILTKLRPLMQKMQNDCQFITIDWKA